MRIFITNSFDKKSTESIMNKVGFIGIGKLGMPCAEAIAQTGHDVKGYDVAV
jgi:UDP-N-acetyl-D-mannosaminuronate dehydrogenase